MPVEYGFFPWCEYLAAQEGVEPQLHADNPSLCRGILECSCVLLDSILGMSVGWQEPAPSKCVIMSTSRVVRKDIRVWVFTHEGDRWTVKLDVRVLGGHLHTTFRDCSATLAARVRLVIARLVLIFVLPLDFHWRLRVVRSMFIPGALHGIEASFLAMTSSR